MGDPLSKLKARSLTDLLPNPNVSNDAQDNGTIVGSEDKLPRWVKMVIGSNVIMVHLVVVLVGIVDIPFTLNDATLAAYVVIGLGVPVGLANQTVRSALSVIFGIKS